MDETTGTQKYPPPAIDDPVTVTVAPVVTTPLLTVDVLGPERRLTGTVARSVAPIE